MYSNFTMVSAKGKICMLKHFLLSLACRQIGYTGAMFTSSALSASAQTVNFRAVLCDHQVHHLP
jgi:hypothetical protein